MGIFGRSNKVADSGGASIISNGAKIEGKLRFSQSFFLDGEVEGEISSQEMVTIGKQGLLKGTIVAKTVIVGGEISGRIDCESCEILSSGRVKGEVHSASLVIEAGGILEGSSYVKNSEIPSAQSVKKNGSE